MRTLRRFLGATLLWAGCSSVQDAPPTGFWLYTSVVTSSTCAVPQVGASQESGILVIIDNDGNYVATPDRGRVVDGTMSLACSDDACDLQLAVNEFADSPGELDSVQLTLNTHDRVSGQTSILLYDAAGNLLCTAQATADGEIIR